MPASPGRGRTRARLHDLCQTAAGSDATVFDFRYHVASLAAVFLALMIGILVGVGISGHGLRQRRRARSSTSRSTTCRADRDAARAQRDALAADASVPRRRSSSDAYPP